MMATGAEVPDFSAHNEEVREVWAAYHAGTPIRVPMVLGINPRYLICEQGANAIGLDFRTYSESPDAMFEAQLRFRLWTRFHLFQDAEMGLPDAWSVYVDFQNYYEAAWFGCPVEYRHGQVPDAAPIYCDDPEKVMVRGAPGPFDGVMGRAVEFHDRLSERARDETFMDRAIVAQTPGTGMGTDGPMTVACSLLSAGVVCEMMASEPDRLGRLLAFITDATIRRVAAWKDRYGVAYPHDGYGIADDSIALISVAAYRRHILPLHRRLFDAFGTANGRSIHLCGDATRHFRTIRDELGVGSFDTGYPVDFGGLRDDLGPDVHLYGGPSAPFLAAATADEAEAETAHILRSGVARGGRFVLREGNNLAPGTPAENIRRMYDTVRRVGRYDAGGQCCMPS